MVAKHPSSDSKSVATQKLTADAWAQEALTVIGESGLPSVAVEPLAKRLGATKGSFYWHYPNRRALVEAALEIWEREHTEAVIDTISAEADPAAQLRALLVLVVGYSRGDKIEVALLASANDPAVAAVVERVTRRRIDHVAYLYRQLGVDADRARRQATIAVSVYLGHTQLAHVSAGLIPGEDEWERYLEQLIEVLTPTD